MQSATRLRNARIVAAATGCKIARSSPAPREPGGGRQDPASPSSVACSPAGVSVMSASRAGNSLPPGPVDSHRSVSCSGIIAHHQVPEMHLYQLGRTGARTPGAYRDHSSDPLAVGFGGG